MERVMTPTEIKSALEEIRAEGSAMAYISLSVSISYHNSGSVISASFYPDDITGQHKIHAKGDSFAEAIENLRAKWNEEKSLANRNAIRKMALAIIEITTDRGECSDAALRGAGFHQVQIDRIGLLACDEATRLAAGGPFSIRQTAGANGEPASLTEAR
jgi:hypothetical protein